MRLICPCCFAALSIEALTNDPAARQTLDIISKLPGPVAGSTPAYLGLFRTSARGLAWKRALRIAEEVRDLVSKGKVHWDGGEERPAPAALWAEVMDRMVSMRKEGLTDHNYLRKVVWSEAKSLAARAESASNKTGLRHEDCGPSQNPLPSSVLGAQDAPVRKSCFNCDAFRPPKACSAQSAPVSGNEMIGCGKWTAKSAAIGDILGGLLPKLEPEETEKI